jgi:hypothetical protein
MKTGIFVGAVPLSRSPSVLNLARALVAAGDEVTLVCRNCGPVPRLDGVRTVDLSRGLLAAAAQRLLLSWSRPDLGIAVEPAGFWLAAQLLPKRRIIYYSLELNTQDQAGSNYYPDRLRTFEERSISRSGGLIIQSEERKQVFVDRFGLSDNFPTFLLPVCATSESFSAAPRDLPHCRRPVVLHMGGLSSAFELGPFSQAISRLTDWQLRLHGHLVDDEIEDVRSSIRNGAYTNISIDEGYFDSPSAAEAVCGEAEVGLAWYRPGMGPNFDTAELSSGKIAAYLKYGMPVIARKVGGIHSILEASGCAVALNHPAEIGEALGHIRRNFTAMSKTAKAMFLSHYRFESYQAQLINFLRCRAAAATGSRLAP